MITIYEWRPTYDTQVICGHTISAGQKACKLSISVCRDDVACLPQAIKAALNAQKQQTQKPSLLYRLWHTCFGTKPKKTSVQRGTHEQMIQPPARQKVRPDYGHTIKAYPSVRTRESSQLLAVLSACLRVLQTAQAVPQPGSVTPAYAAKNVYCYAGYHQPSA